jgi:Protein of unknown function (DUF3341)
MWGVLAQFPDAEALTVAARRLRLLGYRRLDAFTPHPSDEVADAIGLPPTRIGMAVLIGALAGAAGGYALQWWTMVVDYPINVGGRPLHSWPAFVPITFEVMVLTAAIVGIVALFVVNRFPEPHHPLFAVPAFEHASQDAFFLAVEASDAKFSLDVTPRILERLGALLVRVVPDA